MMVIGQANDSGYLSISVFISNSILMKTQVETVLKVDVFLSIFINICIDV